MKKVLFLGAGFLQAFIISKAKQLGYFTLAIDKNADSAGFKLADEYSVVDIVDEKACLEYARDNRIDGVLTVATDYGVLSSSYIAQQMKLPGLKYETAKIVKNKYEVRKKLFENSIDNVSQFYEVSNEDDIIKLKDKINYPVMVKPCDGSGSKAAKRVNDSFELDKACKEAMGSSLVGKALIEDFFFGKEYGVESFVYNSEVYVLGIMNKQMTAPPNYAELGHSMPSKLMIEQKIKKIVKRAITALDINFGSVNMDILVDANDNVCIVDIGARMGGNLIGSHIIPIGTGIDYPECIIKAAVGDSFSITPCIEKKEIATRLLALSPGKIKSLPDFGMIEREYNVEIFHHLDVGSTIREYKNNLDGCGYILATANDVEEAISRAEKAKLAIDKNIIRY